MDKIKYIIMLSVAVLILTACGGSPPPSNQPYHIHPTLEIEILGAPYPLPAGIGLDPHHHQPIHTHDTTGELHVESPVTRNFYLKEFFHIWDKRFDQQCFVDYCTNSTHELKAYVNGVEDARFGDILLQENQEIRIVYSRKEK